MLIHLEHYTCSFLHSYPPFFPRKNPRTSILLSKSKKSRRNYNAGEKDSEFEVDPEEARQALRNLDKQLQSLSTKKVGTPKIKASEVKQRRYEGEENAEVSGSIWAYAAAFLLLFTIFYNILFLTVIKPSIDGPLPLESTYDMIK